MSEKIVLNRKFTGRTPIYTSVEEITRDNILDVLKKALPIHQKNAYEIDYLQKYRKGDTPIHNRTKDVRPEICNIISENRADEIVNFKTGYLVGEPIQYVTRKGTDEKATDEIIMLNEMMDAECRDTRDIELCEHLHTCGIGYKIVLVDETGEEDETPFRIIVPNSLDTFVIKSSALGHKPMLGVHVVTIENNGIRKQVYSCYAKNKYFEIENASVITREEDTVLKDIPIIEYKLNSSYLGAFEIVLPLLDAINRVQSNRLDGVEQFIQSLLVITNANIDDETNLDILKNSGLIVLPDGGDIKYLVQQLSQSDTKTLIDGLYQDVLTICGMPNRNGGTSTSDTGNAVVLRDGWSDCEARAKTSEKFYKESERRFLRLVINTINTKLKVTNLKQSDIDIRFTRRNYENIANKTTVLTQLLGSEKVHPKLAFEHCGLFSDPSLAYEESVKYIKEKQQEELSELQNTFNSIPKIPKEEEDEE